MEVQKMQVDISDLNLRARPNILGKIIKTLKKNTILDVLEIDLANWAKVKLKDGTIGYVQSRYLSIICGCDDNDANNEFIIKPDANNELLAIFNGAFKNISLTSKLIHVNNLSSESMEDGSPYFPYKTIQAAINYAPETSIIIIYPGEYDEDIVIDNKNNISLTSIDKTIGQSRTVISGGLLITGNSKRIGIDNIQIDGVLALDNTEGLCYFTNVAIGEIETTEKNKGYNRFDFAFIHGDISLQGESTIDIKNSAIEQDGIIVSENALLNLILDNVDGVQLIHNFGNVLVRGTTNFIGLGIQSIADDLDGVLFILSGNFLALDGYAPIHKTGDCKYIVHDSIIRNKATDKLVGINLELISKEIPPIEINTDLL